MQRHAYAFAGAAIALLALGLPAAAEFRVCNKSGTTVDVAFGYDGGGKSGWIAEGWYKINTGRCATVYSGRLNNRYYYLYAEGANGADWDGEQGAGASFCINRTAFKLFQRRYGDNDADDCQKHMLESKRFFEVNVGEHLRWIQTLDPGPSPGKPAAPAPQPAPGAGAPPGAPSAPPPRGSACERFPNLC